MTERAHGAPLAQDLRQLERDAGERGTDERRMTREAEQLAEHDPRGILGGEALQRESHEMWCESRTLRRS